MIGKVVLVRRGHQTSWSCPLGRRFRDRGQERAGSRSANRVAQQVYLLQELGRSGPRPPRSPAQGRATVQKAVGIGVHAFAQCRLVSGFAQTFTTGQMAAPTTDSRPVVNRMTWPSHVMSSAFAGYDRARELRSRPVQRKRYLIHPMRLAIPPSCP